MKMNARRLRLFSAAAVIALITAALGFFATPAQATPIGTEGAGVYLINSVSGECTLGGATHPPHLVFARECDPNSIDYWRVENIQGGHSWLVDALGFCLTRSISSSRGITTATCQDTVKGPFHVYNPDQRWFAQPAPSGGTQVINDGNLAQLDLDPATLLPTMLGPNTNLPTAVWILRPLEPPTCGGSC